MNDLVEIRKICLKAQFLTEIIFKLLINSFLGVVPNETRYWTNVTRRTKKRYIAAPANLYDP